MLLISLVNQTQTIVLSLFGKYVCSFTVVFIISMSNLWLYFEEEHSSAWQGNHLHYDCSSIDETVFIF